MEPKAIHKNLNFPSKSWKARRQNNKTTTKQQIQYSETTSCSLSYSSSKNYFCSVWLCQTCINLSSRLNQFHFLLGVSLLDSNFLFIGVDFVAIFVSYDLFQDLVKTKFWSTKQTLYPIIMALIAWLYNYAQRTF